MQHMNIAPLVPYPFLPQSLLPTNSIFRVKPGGQDAATFDLGLLFSVSPDKTSCAKRETSLQLRSACQEQRFIERISEQRTAGIT
jgi:hypothetical protein